jgi:hypothetical protein
MASRSERLTALVAGPLAGGDPLLLSQSFVIWKRRVGFVSLGVAFLGLVFASFMIGYELGVLLFNMSR